MPTERFFRLSPEKQKAIRAASMREFSRAPLENVSINKIIQDAEISRGSFYTYFEDKRDVMRYLTEQISIEMKGYFLACFQEHKGNMFETYRSILEYIVHSCMEADTQQLVQNILSIMGESDFVIGGRSMAEYIEKRMEEYIRHKYQDMDSLNMKKKMQEFKAVNQIFQALMCQEVGMYFMKDKSEQEIMQDFRLKMEIVYRGIQEPALVGKPE